MASQKSSLYTGVAAEIGRADLATTPDASGVIPAARWYDEALRLIEDAALWRFLVTPSTRPTVIGQVTYGLPDDFRDFFGLNYEVTATNQWKILKIPSVAWRQKYAGATNARSKECCIIGNQLFLGPPPSDVVTLRLDYYYVHPAVTDSQASMLPPHIEDVQRVYMLGFGYRTLREWEKMKGALELAEGMLKRAVQRNDITDTDAVNLQPFRAVPAWPPGNYWQNPFVR